MSNGKVSHPIGSGRSRTSKRGIEGAQEKLEELMEADAAADEAVEEKVYSENDLSELKSLIFLGYSSEIVEFHGFRFEVSTLRNSEKREIISELAKRGKEMAAYVKTTTLAKAIRSVNGRDMLDSYDGDDDATDLEKRVQIVDEWQSSLVAKLYDIYEALADKSDALFTSTDETDGEEKLKK